MQPSPVLAIIAAVAVLAGTAAVAIVTIADEGEPRQGGSPPDLTMPQSARADDAGISFVISNAQFSGTGTFVEIAATETGEAKNGTSSRSQLRPSIQSLFNL